jgi:hypothetical protein
MVLMTNRHCIVIREEILTNKKKEVMKNSWSYSILLGLAVQAFLIIVFFKTVFKKQAV